MKAALPITRREFLALSTVSSLAVVAGCATVPSSGRRAFLRVSQAEEQAMDQQASPHQFSADYGAVPDNELNAYLATVGHGLAAHTEGWNSPYSLRAVNAVEINAYTFPAGSVAVTRGMLLDISSEAELAAVLGHELGHVNSRHVARAISKGLAAGTLAAAVSTYAEYKKPKYTWLAAGLGGIGAGMLLASYSRANEREADELGMRYMVANGYSPQGMVDVMDILRHIATETPWIIQVLFATHPMSEERYQAAAGRAAADYAGARDLPLHKERFMDQTARLRKLRTAVKSMQKGEQAMGDARFKEAEGYFAYALRCAPTDYAGLLLMAKCQLAMGKAGEARRYCEFARQAYPDEPQAHHVMGMIHIAGLQFDEGLTQFHRYEDLLPGNPVTLYHQGYCMEKLGRERESAEAYLRFVNQVGEGEDYERARRRLLEWGYVKPPAPPSP